MGPLVLFVFPWVLWMSACDLCNYIHMHTYVVHVCTMCACVPDRNTSFASLLIVPVSKEQKKGHLSPAFGSGVVYFSLTGSIVNCQQQELANMNVKPWKSLKGHGVWGRLLSLEERKRHSSLQEGQAGGCGELQSVRHHLGACEGVRLDNSGKHIKYRKVIGKSKNGFTKREVIPYHPGSLL